MINYQTITIDLQPDYREPVVQMYLSERDVGRPIQVNVLMQGQPYSFTAGTTVHIDLRKPSGHVVQVNGNYAVGSNVVLFNVVEQMAAEPGMCLTELSIVGDGQDPIGSKNWLTKVELSPMHAGDPSETWIEDLDELVQDAMEGHIDATLSIPGDAADAAAVGEELADLKSATRNIANVSCGRYSASLNTGVISPSSGQTVFGLSDKVPCEPNTQYAISLKTEADISPAPSLYVFYYSEDAYLSYVYFGAVTSAVIITPNDAKYIYVHCYRSGSLTVEDNSLIQIEKGYTVTEKISPVSANDVVARQGETVSIPYTEHKGYFSQTGGISNPTASNEYYTDKIDVSLFKTIGAKLKYTESRALWIAYATYDADGNFVSRSVLRNATMDAYGSVIQLSNEVKYVAFCYRKYTDGLFEIFGTLSDSGILNRVLSINENDSEKLGDFPLRFKPCYDHLFVNTSMPYITIPHESLYHVRLSRLFGFNVIEANVASTSDGVYIVNHLESGNFGKYFHHADGTTDISNVACSSVTWDWIVQNVRYNSSIVKYQTRPCRLEEFLAECRQQNIIPFIYSIDENVVKMADEYMGKDNYIAYGASREKCPTAIIYHWVTRTTKADILEYCESIGKPFIYGMSNPTAFSDADLQDIINTLHEKGYWIGVSYADDDWYKYSAMGVDANGTQKYINRLNNGNLCNYDTTFNFSDFTVTNAVESDGILTFTNEGFIEPNVSADNLTLGAVDIEIWFNGTITVYGIGEQAFALTYTSDGTQPFFMATPVINKTPKFRIKATSGTIVKDIKFRASKV